MTVPVGIGEALANLRKTWVRPDGEELVDALELARVAREMAAGAGLTFRKDPAVVERFLPFAMVLLSTCDGTKPGRSDRQPAWLWSGLFAATTN